MKRGRKFELDRANGKLMGVCAGIADATGWDVTLIRVGFVVSAIAGFPWVPLGYFVLAFIGKPKARAGFDGMAAPRKSSAFEARRSMTDLDRRIAEVETYVASQNGSLAREIESLR